MGSDTGNITVKTRIGFYSLQKTMAETHNIMTLPDSKNERAKTSISFTWADIYNMSHLQGT